MSPTLLSPVLTEGEGAVVLPVSMISLLTLLCFPVDDASFHSHNQAKLSLAFVREDSSPLCARRNDLTGHIALFRPSPCSREAFAFLFFTRMYLLKSLIHPSNNAFTLRWRKEGRHAYICTSCCSFLTGMVKSWDFSFCLFERKNNNRFLD